MDAFRYPREKPELLAYACRILASMGISDSIWGHVSLRDPGAGTYWMKPATFGFEEMLPAHMIELSLEGEVISGEYPKHLEYPIHSEIFRRRPEVCSVLHVHPLHAIALSATGQRLRPVSHEGTLFCEPDIPCFEQTSDLIATEELGGALAEVLGDHRAAFLRNHGIVTAGRAIHEAVAYALFLERAARVQLLAGSAGEFQSTSGPEIELKRMRIYAASQLELWWKYQCRQVGELSEA